jgi:hypothetical protein
MIQENTKPNGEPVDMPKTQEDGVAQSPAPAPTWFSRTYGDKDMAANYRETSRANIPPPPIAADNAAYEAYRRRLEERFKMAQHAVEPNMPKQDNVAFPRRPVFAHGDTGHPQQIKRTAPKKNGFSRTALTILTLTACSVGGLGGYFAANPAVTQNLFKGGYATIAGLWTTAPEAPKSITLGKKSIRIAKVDVRDVSGGVNTPIPLELSALPADAQTPVALRITGLPAEAYLTKGVELTEGEWLLKSAEIGKAELVVPHTEQPNISLQVAALEEATGIPAAPVQALRVAIDMNAVPAPGVPLPPRQPQVDEPVIQPTAANPETGVIKKELPMAVPAPLESVNPEANALIKKGDVLLASGDMIAARQFYLKAFSMRTPQAAYGVGQTYDPAVYAKHKIKALVPDPQIAAEWYGKAAAVGHSEASAALSGLPGQP